MTETTSKPAYTYLTDWVEETIPITEMIPHYSDQDSFIIHKLTSTNCVQGISANREGETLCINPNSTILEEYPRRDNENLIEYSKRVFGFCLSDASEEQKRARDTLMAQQIKEKMSEMYAYTYPDVVMETTANNFSPSYYSAFSNKHARGLEDHLEEEEKKMEVDHSTLSLKRFKETHGPF